MKIPKILSGLLFSLVTCVKSMGYYNPLIIAKAEELGDNVGDSGSSVSGMLKGHSPLTTDNLAVAQSQLSPVTTAVGYLVGGAVVLITVGIFAITALDLIYLSFPFTRKYLFVDGGGNGTERRQLVSDEAVQCLALMGNNQQSATSGGSSFGGSSFGGSSFGGSSFGGSSFGGGMGASSNSSGDNSPKTKSVLAVYFKKRIVFMILLGVCVITLTSSIFLDTGINLAEWFIKIMNSVNGSISNL